MPDVIKKGSTVSIPVYTEDSSKIDYFFTNSEGESVASGSRLIDSGETTLILNEAQTSQFGIGANDLKVFAVSESVLRPDIYSVSFLASSETTSLPDVSINEIQTDSEKNEYVSIAAIILGVIIVGSIMYIRNKRKKSLRTKS